MILLLASLRGVPTVLGPRTLPMLPFVYAAGAAISLTLALVIGGRMFALMKRSLGAGEWVRRVLGALMLVGVASIALGADNGLRARVSLAGTNGTQQGLIDMMLPTAAAAAEPALPMDASLPIEGTFPSLAGATQWFNSAPLTPASLRGKVVLVDFWTYSCINCLHSLPYVEAWYRKYRDHGLVVIGVHSPEFAFEKAPSSVAEAVQRLGVRFPVALDDDYAIWRGFHNQYWPASYFIDGQGRIRHHAFGEGGYIEGEDVIRHLLANAGYKDLPGGYVHPGARGAEAASSDDNARSPEPCAGYARAEKFAGRGPAQDAAFDHHGPESPATGQWALDGRRAVHAQDVVPAPIRRATAS